MTVGIDMSYWNQGYNQKKQDQQKTQRSPHHDIYLGNSSWSNSREAKRKEAFAWKVGGGIITIMTGLFIWALITIL
jgi:hypothetical protein